MFWRRWSVLYYLGGESADVFLIAFFLIVLSHNIRSMRSPRGFAVHLIASLLYQAQTINSCAFW